MKKLLIVTQKVNKNDPILGFFHRWIIEFAKHWQTVTIICLEKGEYKLPENVKVLSLGKEKGGLKIGYFLNFYKYIWRERKNYDAVFVHMNPIYIVFGGIFWRLSGKKIALWYTHKSVDLKLRIAEVLTHKIFTASKESFRLNSKKMEVMGHGIDMELFKPISRVHGECFEICSVARISQTKNQHVMIDTIEVLKNNGFNARLFIVGNFLTSKDKVYEEMIKNKVKDKNLSKEVFFCGTIIPQKIPAFLQKMDLFINLSNTGSVDKAVLEAMACGINVLTSNEAFKSILPTNFYVDNKNPITIARNIIQISRIDKENFDLRKIVLERYNLIDLIRKVSKILN